VPPVVEGLYFAGANVNLRTAQGRPPLHVSAQYVTGADEGGLVIRDFVLHQFKASLACADPLPSAARARLSLLGYSSEMRAVACRR
jgi:hypothetical protein